MTPTPLTAQAMLDREFLEVRARLLEIAAALDRIDRAAGSLGGDPRMEQIRQAIALLDQSRAARAELVQQVFSRQYDPQWRDRMTNDEIPNEERMTNA
jgi:hypothetical protein